MVLTAEAVVVVMFTRPVLLAFEALLVTLVKLEAAASVFGA